MVITIAFVVGLAWSTIVIVSAVQHGRTVGRTHRVSIAIGLVGVLLVLPALLIGTYGLPVSWSYWWLGVVARVGYVGLGLVGCAAVLWLLLDTAFVWRERHRVFPFAFRRPPGSEA
jgi:hypothetical protein